MNSRKCTCFASGARDGGHDGRFQFFDDLFQVQQLDGVAQKGRQSASAAAPLSALTPRPVDRLHHQFVVDFPFDGREIQIVSDRFPFALGPIQRRINQIVLTVETLLFRRLPLPVFLLQPMDGYFFG